jgi:hypothetical protein
MFGTLKFILVALLAVGVVGIVSIVWPSVTGKPRPDLLEQAFKITRNTQLGQQTAAVLGVSDSKINQPIDLNSIASQAVNTISQTVETKAREIVARQAIIQLVGQIDKLNPDEKMQIKNLLCQPVASNSAK